MTTSSVLGYIAESSHKVEYGVSPLSDTVTSYTTTGTLTPAQFQGAIDNTGGGGIVLTLPAAASVTGKSLRATCVIGSLTLSGPAANTLWYGGRSYQTVLLGAVFNTVEIYSDGTAFYVTSIAGPGAGSLT